MIEPLDIDTATSAGGIASSGALALTVIKLNEVIEAVNRMTDPWQCGVVGCEDRRRHWHRMLRDGAITLEYLDT